MTRSKLWQLSLATAFASAAANAEETRTPLPSQSFQDLLNCRQIADPQLRLVCFDSQAALVAAANDRRDIIVTDKGEIRKTRRKLFGFSMPASTLLSDDGDNEDANRLDSSVTSARRNRDGGWIVQIADGGTWEQIDSKILALSPKAGQKVIITKGALGSFFMSIDGQAALKMRRVQ